MEYSEKDMEQTIVEECLLGEKYDIRVLENQYRTEYGVIDILGFYPPKNRLIVVELKKREVDENAVGQIMRYMAAMSELVEDLKKLPDAPKAIQDLDIRVDGILIGDGATDGVRAIVRNFSFLSFIDATVYLNVRLRKIRVTREPDSMERDITRFLGSDFIEDLLKYSQLNIKEEINTESATGTEG